MKTQEISSTMLKITLFIVTMLCGLKSFTQKALHFKKKCGVLVFEGQQNNYGVYFIETPLSKSFSFRKADTIKIIGIGTPGDNANAVPEYRHYLKSLYKFDTTSGINIIDNNNGMYIKDSCIFEYKKGCISFIKSNSYKLQKQFEKKLIGNKEVIFELEDFIPIDSFSSNLNTRKKVLKR